MAAEQDAKSDSEKPKKSRPSHDKQPTKATRERKRQKPPPPIVEAADSPPKFSRDDDAALAVQLICGKWGIRVLTQLSQGVVRPGQLQRAIHGISRKMVTDTLRHLESYGLVARLDLSGRVLHVQYRLRDDLPRILSSLLDALAEFGAADRALRAEGVSDHEPRGTPTVPTKCGE
jgi:DNA-binding HxlR family transcriptional regulator